MILGIGNDIIEIKRIEQATNRTQGFIEKIFTENERAYFLEKNGKIESVAANFAAKEAVSKALGTGFRGFEPCDIEILRNELGKPYVNLSQKIKDLISPVEIYKIHVSLSHCKEYATAYVLIEGCE